jgi:hypothetical protein
MAFESPKDRHQTAQVPRVALSPAEELSVPSSLVPRDKTKTPAFASAATLLPTASVECPQHSAVGCSGSSKTGNSAGIQASFQAKTRAHTPATCTLREASYGDGDGVIDGKPTARVSDPEYREGAKLVSGGSLIEDKEGGSIKSKFASSSSSSAASDPGKAAALSELAEWTDTRAPCDKNRPLSTVRSVQSSVHRSTGGKARAKPTIVTDPPYITEEMMDEHLRHVDLPCWLQPKDDKYCIGAYYPRSMVLCGLCCAPLSLSSLTKHISRGKQHKSNKERWNLLLEKYKTKLDQVKAHEDPEETEGETKRAETPVRGATGTRTFTLLVIVTSLEVPSLITVVFSASARSNKAKKTTDDTVVRFNYEPSPPTPFCLPVYLPNKMLWCPLCKSFLEQGSLTSHLKKDKTHKIKFDEWRKNDRPGWSDETEYAPFLVNAPSDYGLWFSKLYERADAFIEAENSLS